ILTATSLMVAEPAAEDAIRRARSLPRLGVGLHVVVVCGRPILSPEQVPDLVGPDGMFTADLARAGVRYFFQPRARRQLEAEIRAQFAAFAASGLPFDHVNAQSHFHLHPTVFGLILRIAREYGSPPIRIPYEPFGPSWRATGDLRGLRFANAYLLAPWLAMMRARLDAGGFAHNDRVLGLSDVGRMTPARVTALLGELGPGVTEVFFHCATGRWPGIDPALTDYQLEDELAALTSPAVAALLRGQDVERIAFADLRRAS
ncbi:MAG: hopanoid biosynthesis-associated protein HpnK, partial [Vulcanimicrobiaceae bacterium]